MKTIQLSERELSMIFSMLTPPYPVRDTHTDEFNELRNKVFYALRDAKNDEPVSNRDELPLDYLQGHKDGLEWAAQLAEANHPHTGDWLYDDPIELAKAIRKGPDMPEGGNSPVVPDGWKQWVSDVIEYLENGLEAEGELEAQGSIDAKRLLAAAPQQEGK